MDRARRRRAASARAPRCSRRCAGPPKSAADSSSAMSCVPMAPSKIRTRSPSRRRYSDTLATRYLSNLAPARLYTAGRANRASRVACSLVEHAETAQRGDRGRARARARRRRGPSRRSRSPARWPPTPWTPSAPAFETIAPRPASISSVSNCSVPATYSGYASIASRTTSQGLRIRVCDHSGKRREARERRARRLRKLVA